MKKSKFEKFKTKQIFDTYVVGGLQSCSTSDTNLSGQPDYEKCTWNPKKTVDVKNIYMCAPGKTDYISDNPFMLDISNY